MIESSCKKKKLYTYYNTNKLYRYSTVICWRMLNINILYNKSLHLITYIRNVKNNDRQYTHKHNITQEKRVKRIILFWSHFIIRS